MGYWKSKILPKIKKVFEKNNGNKKAAAAEACKSFDDSKEEINKEFEEKKAELQPKVLEIYEASSAEIKTLVKEPREAGLKKNSTAVNNFLEELVKIEFPGSKAISEASSKYGAVFVSGPVFFVLEKVSTFIVTEEKPRAETKPAEEETSSRDITVEEEKKEVAAAVLEPAAEPAAAPQAAPSEPAPAPAGKKDQPAEPPKPQ